MSEYEDQKSLASWLDAMHVLWYHVPNERKLTPRQGAALNAQGRKKGVPDVCICVPREHKGVFRAGMYLELKTKKGRPTKEQKEWIAALNMSGYHAVIAHGLDDAIRQIELYLSKDGD